MKLTEKIFGLKRIPPFERLGYSELVAIAEVAHTKRYAAGERVIAAGHIPQRLFAVVEGRVVGSGIEIPPVFGVRSLLDETPIDEELSAGDEGAVCLLISKGHFYRILNEFPEFTLGFQNDDPGAKTSEEEGLP